MDKQPFYSAPQQQLSPGCFVISILLYFLTALEILLCLPHIISVVLKPSSTVVYVLSLPSFITVITVLDRNSLLMNILHTWEIPLLLHLTWDLPPLFSVTSYCTQTCLDAQSEDSPEGQLQQKSGTDSLKDNVAYSIVTNKPRHRLCPIYNFSLNAEIILL